jgi:hypothetical protein
MKRYGDELDLEAIGVLEVGRVVVRATGEWMAVGVQQGPGVLGGLLGESIDELGGLHVEGHVVESGSAAIVVDGGEVWGLLDDD